MAKIIVHLFVIVAFVACSYEKNKSENAPLEGSGPNSYAVIREKILIPNCLACHAGGQAPTLTTYENVLSNLKQIKEQVLEKKRMPKRGPLKDSELSLLRQWIEAGAPRGPELSPTPVLERAVVTGEMLREKILEPKCISCHFAKNPNQLSDLSDLNYVRSNIGIVYLLSVISDQMPPPPPNLGEAKNPNALYKSEKETLSYWVIDGMQ